MSRRIEIAQGVNPPMGHAIPVGLAHADTKGGTPPLAHQAELETGL